MNSNEPDTDYFRKKLLQMRHDILKEEEAGKEGTKPVELDQSRVGRLSRMDAMQSQAMAVEAARRRKVVLQQIDAAIKRIDNGTFGLCMRCEEYINPGRLEINPSAVVCVECAGGI